MARAADGGAEVRTTSGPLSPMVIVDRETALIPGADGHGALVVTQPGIVHFMTEVFEHTWVTAAPLDARSRAHHADALLSGVRRTIVLLLAEGQTDAMIARRIGVSVRTCRSHIARIYQEFGARSRFQLGVLVAGRGLLCPAQDAAAHSGASTSDVSLGCIHEQSSAVGSLPRPGAPRSRARLPAPR